MNKYIEILKAVDVAHKTRRNVIEIPNSFLDAELEETLSISTGSALGRRHGQLGPFRIVVHPDVRTSYDLTLEDKD
jgi:hypothetical protein